MLQIEFKTVFKYLKILLIFLPPPVDIGKYLQKMKARDFLIDLFHHNNLILFKTTCGGIIKAVAQVLRVITGSAVRFLW